MERRVRVHPPKVVGHVVQRGVPYSVPVRLCHIVAEVVVVKVAKVVEFGVVAVLAVPPNLAGPGQQGQVPLDCLRLMGHRERHLDLVGQFRPVRGVQGPNHTLGLVAEYAQGPECNVEPNLDARCQEGPPEAVPVFQLKQVLAVRIDHRKHGPEIRLPFVGGEGLAVPEYLGNLADQLGIEDGKVGDGRSGDRSDRDGRSDDRDRNGSRSDRDGIRDRDGGRSDRDGGRRGAPRLDERLSVALEKRVECHSPLFRSPKVVGQIVQRGLSDGGSLARRHVVEEVVVVKVAVVVDLGVVAVLPIPPNVVRPGQQGQGVVVGDRTAARHPKEHLELVRQFRPVRGVHTPNQRLGEVANLDDGRVLVPRLPELDALVQDHLLEFVPLSHLKQFLAVRLNDLEQGNDVRHPLVGRHSLAIEERVGQERDHVAKGHGVHLLGCFLVGLCLLGGHHFVYWIVVWIVGGRDRIWLDSLTGTPPLWGKWDFNFFLQKIEGPFW